MAGESLKWPERMAIIVWALWKWRNDWVFKNEEMSLPRRLKSLMSSLEEVSVALRMESENVISGGLV